MFFFPLGFFSTTQVSHSYLYLLFFFFFYFVPNHSLSLSLSLSPYFLYFYLILEHSLAMIRNRERTSDCLLHTCTANHDLLTSPLCLHFCFLFSFFFISLHSHTQLTERVGLRLSLFSNEKRESFFYEKWKREQGRKRNRGKRKKFYILFNQVIILIDKIFWMCYSKRYSILYFKRGTIATPFQNIEIKKLLEWISCVFALQNWL